MSVMLTVQQARTLARLAAESPDGAVMLHQLSDGGERPRDVYAAPGTAREPQVCIAPNGDVDPIEPRGSRSHPLTAPGGTAGSDR